jgi:glycosyltransferase involved in cell wall biosynthesis
MPYKKSTDPASSPKPLRILHVVGGMDRGGAETWLMHVLRHIDRQQFQMDFLVPDERHYHYTDELQSWGCKILPCLQPSLPRLYATNFKRIIRENDPYDAIHVHVHHFSGYVLYLAKQAGIPARIIHSHIDTSALEAQSSWKRKLYTNSMEWLIKRKSTAGLATSRRAAADLLGTNWQKDARWRTLYCGIDLAPFAQSIDPLAVRTELGIPADAIVVGHVGRFEPQKNHDFLLEIAAEMAQREPKMRLLLMGTGSLLPAMQAKVAQLGLSQVVIFGGVRSDIPRLMKGAMDVFIFPSLYEGLGLVLVEAQAAGLPCVLADIVPEEADLVAPLVQRISLTKSAAEWADTVLKQRHSKQLIAQSQALEIVSQSAFNIKISVDELTAFYAGLNSN